MGESSKVTDVYEEMENREWMESLDYVIEKEGSDRVHTLLRQLQIRAQKQGIQFQCPGTTPYINTIPKEKQPPYPGDLELERRIRNIIRWNAMAMVIRANRELSGIGGHISTYASLATLLEVAYNHFFRAGNESHSGDIVYFQGHASPGIYARAFLEGRISEQQLLNFRRELAPQGGLSSYPHPWLMPEFWQFPTVSMGLSPIMAIYQARFNRYLQDRGIKDTSDQKIWAFLGDGEMDEPESMGAITLAAREHLDNLIFVVNCNLQRLDGPVRGNGKIIQELEAAFSGAGWKVIKVIWSSDFDPLFDKDHDGIFTQRLEELVDGQVQKYAASDGAYIRENFFGSDPRLLAMVQNYSDEQLKKLRWGGHDPEKIYTAYKTAVAQKSPVVILAQTIKGYGLGEAGEGRNVTHQQKKLNEAELREFRYRFSIPIPEEQVAAAPFYRPSDDSKEIQYLQKQRQALGGHTPHRQVRAAPVTMPQSEIFNEFFAGSNSREIATTMAFVRLLAKLMKDKNIGEYIVPIVPDESRTFGMESLFRSFGIYSSMGQQYEPVDKESLLFYNEQKNGQILEEGITEAGSMSSFIAAGTSYATHGITMIPFFIHYSMFGFQRVGDLIWAAGDNRAKGFIVGGTAGRTTLPGEGLQHQDGQSHVYAYPYPTIHAYDPAFAYEIAVIVREGIRRMFVEQRDEMFYFTMMNQLYPMPPMPDGVEEGIMKGMYLYKPSGKDTNGAVNIMGSGALVLEALRAQEMLEQQHGIAANVWSVTSYKQLYTDAISTHRWNMLHPRQKPRTSYLQNTLKDYTGVFVAVSDYCKVIPGSIVQWIPGNITILGTDGFGRSDDRTSLRRFFEVDAEHIVIAALQTLMQEKRVSPDIVQNAIQEYGINPEKSDPLSS